MLNGAIRIEVIEGDFFNDQLDDKVDVVLLANILHDWNQKDGLQILRKVYNSLLSI